jgi:hypothetical protein
VTGRGAKRSLRFRIRPIPGQVVRFFEEGPAGRRLLGSTGRARGTMGFRVTGAGRRTVVAAVEQDGVSRATLRPARFTVGARRGGRR